MAQRSLRVLLEFRSDRGDFALSFGIGTRYVLGTTRVSVYWTNDGLNLRDEKWMKTRNSYVINLHSNVRFSFSSFSGRFLSRLCDPLLLHHVVSAVRDGYFDLVKMINFSRK